MSHPSQHSHLPVSHSSMTADYGMRGMISGLLILLSLSLATIASAADPMAAYKMRHYQLQTLKDKPLAPVFSLPSVDGQIHDLSAYRGQVVVVNFWSTWCAPCRKEMPSLERAWQRLKSDRIVVLGIAIQDDPEMVRRFLQEREISFPVLLDSDGKVAETWPFSGIPATFVLDKEGRIIYRALGLREWDSDSIILKVKALALSVENSSATSAK
ncbi:TlpA disulfide reductase family protein [Sedimenticola selenatireducens]|uniref:TlpA family protein disulfide reductase n=1 Tax=Sedimenticola selenatireducens TaxID=191960 RepID=A0A557RY57_9GAMM|nr:TlpA disulfide reductase family protein [Sedimenticola selenatireducens]TVO70059.1 TlpA family protein disulfide reductase [Sedimenticola selenatireducens]TVT61699.1 MAG: TlpA family protein disulfide reductase [Sedimenticola selenatireducens]